MSADLLIYVEHEDGQPRRIALETASKAAAEAEAHGGEVHAVALGKRAGATAARLGEYGVDVLHASDDAVFDEYLAEPAVEAVASVIQSVKPQAVIFPNTQDGKDIGARLAARLGVGIIANVIGIKLRDEGADLTETIFGGNYTTTVHAKHGFPALVMARPNAFRAEAKGKTARVEPISWTPSESATRVKLGEAVQEEGAPVPVDEAGIIVSGGRGLGGPEPFGMLEELAKEIGGVVGASRAAVDAGWISYSHQVGQTGKTVKPQVYIAIGISGAVQHRVGMQTADTIIAINKDGDAPIFQLADFGAVGDLFQIVPALTEEIRKRKAQ